MTLSNAVCLYDASFLPMISANAFYFHVLSWFIDTYFVYFMYPSSLYICAWFDLVIALSMVFLKNALMCIKKSQIN